MILTFSWRPLSSSSAFPASTKEGSRGAAEEEEVEEKWPRGRRLATVEGEAGSGL